jgi:hypothetical protein
MLRLIVECAHFSGLDVEQMPAMMSAVGNASARVTATFDQNH